MSTLLSHVQTGLPSWPSTVVHWCWRRSTVQDSHCTILRWSVAVIWRNAQQLIQTLPQCWRTLGSSSVAPLWVGWTSCGAMQKQQPGRLHILHRWDAVQECLVIELCVLLLSSCTSWTTPKASQDHGCLGGMLGIRWSGQPFAPLFPKQSHAVWFVSRFIPDLCLAVMETNSGLHPEFFL